MPEYLRQGSLGEALSRAAAPAPLSFPREHPLMSAKIWLGKGPGPTEKGRRSEKQGRKEVTSR